MYYVCLLDWWNEVAIAAVDVQTVRQQLVSIVGWWRVFSGQWQVMMLLWTVIAWEYTTAIHHVLRDQESIGDRFDDNVNAETLDCTKRRDHLSVKQLIQISWANSCRLCSTGYLKLTTRALFTESVWCCSGFKMIVKINRSWDISKRIRRGALSLSLCLSASLYLCMSVCQSVWLRFSRPVVLNPFGPWPGGPLPSPHPPVPPPCSSRNKRRFYISTLFFSDFYFKWTYSHLLSPLFGRQFY